MKAKRKRKASTPSSFINLLPLSMELSPSPKPRAIEAFLRCNDASIDGLDLPEIPSLSGKTILACDLGRRTGWAYEMPSGAVESGVHELYDTTKGVRNYQDGQRFYAFDQFLRWIDRQYAPVDVVAFEDVHPGTHKSSRQSQLYAGFRATIMLWATDRGKLIVPLPVGTVKKVISKGNANKDEMVEGIRALGYPTFSEDECDAIATLLCLHRVTHRQSENAHSVVDNVVPFPYSPTVKRRKPKQKQDTRMTKTQKARKTKAAPSKKPAAVPTKASRKPLAKAAR